MKFNSKNGTAIVEFAIVLPLLLLLLMGVIEFSLVLYDKAILTNASREGARAGIVSQNPRVPDGEITVVVNDYCQNYLITFGADKDIATDIIREGASFGDDLTVTVKYKYGFLVLPNFVVALVNPINLSATTLMKME
jgi:Flp pilus assembly protein TadG